MSKTKKATLIFTAIIILACIGLMGYKAIDPVYTLPEPWLGKGISRLNGTNPGGRLVWSPIARLPRSHYFLCVQQRALF